MPAKDEKQKTRPDLDDEHYLVYLSNLPENRGINVYALYKAMRDWCDAKGKTASHLRLLNWLNREREAMPMTAAPIGIRAAKDEAPEPGCKRCNDTGEITRKPKNAKFDWQVEFVPCPDCKEKIK